MVIFIARRPDADIVMIGNGGSWHHDDEARCYPFDRLDAFAVDPEQYRAQHVLVVGGGDSALEAVASIAEQPGTSVMLSYRSEAFGRTLPTVWARHRCCSQLQRVTLRSWNR
jgi:cation diffusion facilitator CzcD-associated flavoprotein CzcO